MPWTGIPKGDGQYESWTWAAFLSLGGVFQAPRGAMVDMDAALTVTDKHV